jgi:hypothetical protein
MQSKKLFKNIEQKSCIPWLPILNYFTLLVNEWYVCGQLNEKSTLMPNFNLVLTLFPHLVGSVQHVFHHVVIKIRQLFLRRAACMTSTLHETGVGANDCKCSRDCLTYLPNKGVWPKFWSPILWLTFVNVAWLPRSHAERTVNLARSNFNIRYN